MTLCDTTCDASVPGQVYGILTSIGNLGAPVGQGIANQIYAQFTPSLSSSDNYIQDSQQFRETVIRTLSFNVQQLLPLLTLLLHGLSQMHLCSLLCLLSMQHLLCLLSVFVRCFLSLSCSLSCILSLILNFVVSLFILILLQVAYSFAVQYGFVLFGVVFVWFCRSQKDQLHERKRSWPSNGQAQLEQSQSVPNKQELPSTDSSILSGIRLFEAGVDYVVVFDNNLCVLLCSSMF